MHNITTDSSAPQALRKIVCFGIHKKPPRRRRVRKFGLIESHVSRKSDHSMEGGGGVVWEVDMQGPENLHILLGPVGPRKF